MGLLQPAGDDHPIYSSGALVTGSAHKPDDSDADNSGPEFESKKTGGGGNSDGGDTKTDDTSE